MATFSENFRNFKKAADINTFPAANEDTSGPSIDEWRNSQDWQNRVALPFSYVNGSHGRRTYGILYVPESAAERVSSTGYIPDEEIEAYGAETMDGRSLSLKGIQDLFSKFRDSFKFETEAVPVQDSARKYRGGVGSQWGTVNNPIPGVSTSNTGAMRRLQQNVVSLQERQNNRGVGADNAFKPQRTFIDYLRQSRGLNG